MMMRTPLIDDILIYTVAYIVALLLVYGTLDIFTEIKSEGVIFGLPFYLAWMVYRIHRDRSITR